ncbi:MAG TPA: hypothetical protein PKY59_13415 [Pyrinomonadaceae bacterium]|nr:hypothetical protein [Pyrinomonadaceae bacterium]
MKIINAFFISILLFTIPFFAQSKNVLADGNPPLTQTMVDRLTKLMQWSLDSDFSDEERSRMRSVLVDYWEKDDEKSIKATVDMLAFEEKIASANDSQKQNLQPQIEQKLLKEFEKDANEPLNKLLFAVYKRNHSASNSGSLEDLIGRWQVSHGNSLTTQNIYTGALGDANGMIAEYDIKPNGSVIYSFFMSQNNYGCVTKIKTSKTGRVSINGSNAIFVYDKDTTTSSDSCNAKNNYTKNLGKTSETLNFNFKRENGKKQFCFTNGQLKDCAVKVD